MISRIAAAALLFSVVGMGGGVPAVSARCPVEVEYSFYDLTGRTIEEVRRQLHERGPQEGGGISRYASTDWSVEYKWPADTDWKRGPEHIDLKCSAKVLLPRLKPELGRTSELIEAWSVFSEQLRQHEMNHIKSVELLAPQIRSRIERARADGEGLSQKRAHLLASDVIAELRRRDRTYDSFTDHGRREGRWDF